MTSEEKSRLSHVELAATQGLKPVKSNFDLDELNDGFDKKKDRKLMFRVDCRLIPPIWLLFGLSIIDRVNIGYAKIDGMALDLDISGARYSVALLMPFVGYCTVEIPSNIMLHKVGARHWIAFLGFGWGLCCLCQGLVSSWAGLVVTRTLLGFLEAGLLSGAVYLLSCWYRRYELQRRLGALYSMSFLASAFSAILAYGINNLDGARNMKGWRWIFIIEGTITCCAAIFAWLVLSDFPAKAKFLTSEERNHILLRIDQDRGDVETQKMSFKAFLVYLKDWKIWAFSLIYLANVEATYALAYFVPTILTSLGYSNSQSNILAAPPYIAALPVLFLESWFTDKTHHRAGVIMFNATLSTVGFAMLLPNLDPHVRFGGIFVAVAGCQPNIPALLSFFANNAVTDSKRNVMTAFPIMWGGVGGIIASTIFRAQDAPNYAPGLYATVGLQGMIVFVTGLIAVQLRRYNRAADRGLTLLEKKDGFRYTI